MKVLSKSCNSCRSVHASHEWFTNFCFKMYSLSFASLSPEPGQHCGSMVVPSSARHQPESSPWEWREVAANRFTLRTLASRWNKQKFRCYEAKIEESEKAGSRRESNPGHLACAASALPLSYNNRTTTSSHNPLYVLHRRY